MRYRNCPSPVSSNSCCRGLPRPLAWEITLMDALRSTMRQGLGLVMLLLTVVPGYIVAEARRASEPARTATPPAPTIDDHIREAASRYDVPEELVAAVITVESQFNPRAVSPKGAKGLMQLMPATATSLGVRDPFDPRDNIHGGVRHLRWLLERFDGNVPVAVAAYNAGEGAVLASGGIPPYRETRQYVKRVMHLVRRARTS
ncbi:MAG TPA: lytic transglycosylase domain-containing protein [Candidatus Tectomicrobia bacterium]|nr:lytic transglycosylase domain-containing protein [Candidatus Tectomicrobia bacterium]